MAARMDFRSAISAVSVSISEVSPSSAMVALWFVGSMGVERVVSVRRILYFSGLNFWAPWVAIEP